MSHFLLSFFCLILSIDSLSTVQILGLFPNHQDAPSGYLKSDPNTHWTTQCIAMFRAAITLANQYGIHVNNQPIHHTIHQITTDGNGFAELDLVCRLITDKTKHDVIGVVGPTSSTNARFLGPFAAQIGLPFVSYAATNAELADTHIYQTFYRTVPSDTLLAEAIVQLFKYFSWKTCTVILGKDDYGYGGLKILSETYHSDLSIAERLIFDPRLDKFHTNLKQTLEKSRSRIVLVWANQSSSTTITRHALSAGLIGGSYIWIMTNKIDLTTFERIHWSKLEGILAVAPIIGTGSLFDGNETLQREALNAWRNSSVDEGNYPRDLSAVSPFAMYTFDAVWTLIQALNKSLSSGGSPSMEESSHCFDSLLKNHERYLMYLKNTRFLGVSGIVKFSKNNSNDRAGGAFYTLCNIQWLKSKNSTVRKLPRYEQVLTWSETSRNWKNCTDSDNIDIVWPSNNSAELPADYPQLRGQHLRILVIDAPPFVIVRNISTYGQVLNNIDNVAHQYGPRSEPLKTEKSNIVIYGFVADFIRELELQMHFNYTIVVADPTTNYHTLVASVENDNRQYEIVISDIRITSSRLHIVDFSASYHENTFRIITRQNPYSSSFNLFSCFNPFTWDVWVAILAVIIYSSVIVYFFERRNIEIENNKFGMHAMCMGICQALTSVLMMNSDMRLRTNSSRLIVLGLYGLGIILVATYTANLSSFLTLSRAQSTISGIDDIKNGHVPFTRIGIVTNSALSDYYIQNISTIYHPLSTAQEMYLRLLDNTIDASMWDSSVLEYAVNNYYCDELTVVGVGFVKSSFGMVLPKDWQYKKDLDIHILAMRESEKLESLENKWLGHRKCSQSSESSKVTGSQRTDIFSLDVMGGLFLSFLILTAIAFGFHLWHYRVTIVTTFWHAVKRIKTPAVKIIM